MFALLNFLVTTCFRSSLSLLQRACTSPPTDPASSSSSRPLQQCPPAEAGYGSCSIRNSSVLARPKTSKKVKGVENENGREVILCEKRLGQKNREVPSIQPSSYYSQRSSRYSGIDNRQSTPTVIPSSQDPNDVFLQCCRDTGIDSKCHSRCNFDTLTKKVVRGYGIFARQRLCQNFNKNAAKSIEKVITISPSILFCNRIHTDDSEDEIL